MNKKKNRKVGSSNSSIWGFGIKKLKIVDKYKEPNGVIRYGTKSPLNNCPTYSAFEQGCANHIFVGYHTQNLDNIGDSSNIIVRAYPK